MAKRKLTQNQQRRINSLHDKRREELITSESQAEGLLITRYGKQAIVEDQSGHSYKCHFRQNLRDIAAGDRVIWCQENHVITAIMPRTSALYKKDFAGHPKLLAANVSCLAIVFAPQPPATFETIDSYLITAEKLKLFPVLIFNKVDLVQHSEMQSWQALLKVYRDLSYNVFITSAEVAQGIEDIKTLLATHTSILVGQSGVGKSSIINRLIPNLELRTGELTEKFLGKHTTSNAALYHLPDGGNIIDSPGVRRFKLEENQPDLLIEGFVEMRELAHTCHFRDCHHINEPKCAIIAAVSSGKISQQRYDSFRTLYSALMT